MLRAGKLQVHGGRRGGPPARAPDGGLLLARRSGQYPIREERARGHRRIQGLDGPGPEPQIRQAEAMRRVRPSAFFGLSYRANIVPVFDVDWPDPLGSAGRGAQGRAK